jgi:hypothetical protein
MSKQQMSVVAQMAPPRDPIFPAVPESKKTARLTLMAGVDAMRTIVAMADAWAKAVGHTAAKEQGTATRSKLKAKAHGSVVALGITVPTEIAKQVEFSAGVYRTNTHEVLTWCVSHGTPKLTVENLIAAFPGRKPSFSLVGVLALDEGLKLMASDFKPAAKAANGSVIGGRKTGPWATRAKPKNKPKATT